MNGKSERHIVIIGGGAGGLMAAITAARRNARVTILERKDRVGKKILVTGNGRCNLTNLNCSVANFRGADPGFVRSALTRFPPSAAVQFFEDLGVCTIVEQDGKVYPRTGQASTILDVLRFECDRLGVTTKCSAEATAIRPVKTHFSIDTVDGKTDADRVIVTTGGRAMPQLTGTGSGFDLLGPLDHASNPVFPALVPLKTACRFNRQLKGVRADAAATLIVNNEPKAEEIGEILFMDYGLSGPPVIQLSLAAQFAMQKRTPVTVILDICPEWSLETLAEMLARRFAARPEVPPATALLGLIHKKLISAVLHGAFPAGEPDMPDLPETSGGMTGRHTAALAAFLKGWPFEITGTLSWQDAHVMGGGIRTADFSPRTLESVRVPGLYCAGEILDVTGDCGGHNLQWAWASGHTAGLCATSIVSNL